MLYSSFLLFPFFLGVNLIKFISDPDEDNLNEDQDEETSFPIINISIPMGEMLHLDDLVDYFKRFIVAVGYPSSLADKIKVLNDKEIAKLYLLEGDKHEDSN